MGCGRGRCPGNCGSRPVGAREVGLRLSTRSTQSAPASRRPRFAPFSPRDSHHSRSIPSRSPCPHSAALQIPRGLRPPSRTGRGPMSYRPVIRPALYFRTRPGLDVVRFLAALWVMFAHAGAVRGGGHAVALFFVLSGYLIGGQLVCEKSTSGTVRLPEFYFKRSHTHLDPVLHRANRVHRSVLRPGAGHRARLLRADVRSTDVYI